MKADTWFQTIPTDWISKRLKVATRLIDKKATFATPDQKYIGLENIESWTGRRIFSENASTESTANQFLPGDVLFGKLRPYLAKAFLADDQGICSTEFLVLRPREYVPKYLLYMLLSKDFIEVVNAWTYGVKMPRANWDVIGNLLAPIPPLSKQARIVEFLDRETAEADALVAKYERLIELLEEKRVAIIAQAVTKGMDAKASMKDFRAEWVGQVPKHWKEPALGYVASVELGKMRTAEPKDAESILVPYLKARNVAADGLRFEPMDRMWCSPSELQDLSVRHEDIIICEGGVTFGRSAIASSSCPSNIIFEKSLHRVRPSHSVDARFLNYAIIALRESGYLHTIAATATFSHLTREKLVAMKFPMPPIDEQRRIVHHIDTQLSQSNKIILKVRAAIDILWERRSTLITAAVTGQIDVHSYRSNEQRIEVSTL